MADQYFIEGKRVNQKQWYAHLEIKYQELHELLTAEQAKSAKIWQELLELRAERESDRQECSACSSQKDKLEATIATMRDLLEELVVASEGDDVEHCVFGGNMHRLEMYIAPSFIDDCRKAISNKVNGEVNQ